MTEEFKYPPRRFALPAAAAKARAQGIVFGPFVFQAVCAMQNLGLFELLWAQRDRGCRIADAAEATGLSEYAVTVLFESVMAAEVLDVEQDRFRLSKVGYYLHHDQLTQVNLSFVRDICYGPLTRLAESLQQGRPAGLSELPTASVEGRGEPSTLYEGLLTLPDPLLESWLAFDHFYSDQSFAQALEVLGALAPERVLDVGANTGRFAARCLGQFPQLEITLLDHTDQLDRARQNLRAAGFEGRFRLFPADLLARELSFPDGMDGVWLSQLLDCFSEAKVLALLEKSAACLRPGGRVYVLEPCWDLQPQESGTFCLLQTSLYFSAVANGNSRMYDSATLTELIHKSGLLVDARLDGLGVGHSLFVCRAAGGKREHGTA